MLRFEVVSLTGLCSNSQFVARTTKTQYCSNKCSSRAYKQAARLEKLEVAKVEASYMGKIRTKVKFPDLEGKQLLTMTEASAANLDLLAVLI